MATKKSCACSAIGENLSIVLPGRISSCPRSRPVHDVRHSHLAPIINPQRPTRMIRLQRQRSQILDGPLPFPITSKQLGEESTGRGEPPAKLVFRVRGIDILSSFNGRFVL